MGSRLVIVINGYRMLKEAFVQSGEVFSDRPCMHVSDILLENKGIFKTSGPVWKEQRAFAVSALKELDTGRYDFEGRIQEDVLVFLQAVAEENEQVFDILILIRTAVANVISSIVFGKRFNYTDQEFVTYLRESGDFLKNVGATAAINYIPLLRHLPGDPFKIQEILVNRERLDHLLIHKSIEEHEKEFDENNISDFISSYLKVMKKKQRGGEMTSMDKGNLTKSIGNLFIAGTDSTASALEWLILYFLRFPDVQQKCFTEVSVKVGRARMPSLYDRRKLPYLEATIMEVLRHADISPLGVNHAVSRDVMFHGYRIPKEAVLIPHIDSVLKDPEIWKDPEDFRPERFIGEDGNVSKPEQFIPFFFGRRSCLGENLAMAELFLFSAAMVQRFQFALPKNAKAPPLDGVLGITYTPKPFKLRALNRK